MEHFCIAGGKADWYNHYGKQCGDSLKKLELKIPFNPAMLLLEIFPEELKTSYHSVICAPMFIAAQFVIAKSWKQPKCPSSDEWLKKMWYFYTMEYYSAIKNDNLEDFVYKWMYLVNILISEINIPTCVNIV